MSEPRPASEQKNVLPPASVWLLRGIHWAKEKALRSCLCGGCLMVGGVVLFPVNPEVGMAVAFCGAGLAVLSFAVLPMLLVLWFPVVFLYHTRYSLRAMLISFLGFGFAVSLMVMADPVAKLVGGLLLLGALGTLISQVLGEYDPVGGTPSKDI
jgi:hypothetical protein